MLEGSYGSSTGMTTGLMSGIRLKPYFRVGDGVTSLLIVVPTIHNIVQAQVYI